MVPFIFIFAVNSLKGATLALEAKCKGWSSTIFLRFVSIVAVEVLGVDLVVVAGFWVAEGVGFCTFWMYVHPSRSIVAIRLSAALNLLIMCNYF
jgi:hypothetical protein